MPITAAMSGVLLRRWRPDAALPLLASVTSDVASRVFDRLPPNRKPPPGHPESAEAELPQWARERDHRGRVHAPPMCWRGEEKVAAGPAFAIATILSIASPASRLYLDRHWTSDVIAGWCLGGSIAAACAAIYESLAPEVG